MNGLIEWLQIASHVQQYSKIRTSYNMYNYIRNSSAYVHLCQPWVVPDNRHLALNKLVEAAMLRWESEETSLESLDTQ